MTTFIGTNPNQIPTNADLGSLAYQNAESVVVGVIVASSGLILNSATIAKSISIDSGNNAMSTGPVTINSGVTVTISSGARYVVI